MFFISPVDVHNNMGYRSSWITSSGGLGSLYFGGNFSSYVSG